MTAMPTEVLEAIEDFLARYDHSPAAFGLLRWVYRESVKDPADIPGLRASLNEMKAGLGDEIFGRPH